MGVESIRKQFSLDWLPGSDSQGKKEPSQLTQSSLHEARAFVYSSGIGNHLLKAPEQQMKLHDLARKVKEDVKQFKFEELWDVVKLLVDRGFIEVDDIQEPSGNYTIKLSKKS
jgi:hypothetical protein